MALRTRSYGVRMLNSGGELDSRLIEVPDGEDHATLLCALLIEMLEETDCLEPGDCFEVFES